MDQLFGVRDPVPGGGSVTGIDTLVARTPDEFRAMRIDVRTEHEVVGLDLAARKAEVHNRAHGRTFQLGFDLLHVARGPARTGPTCRAWTCRTCTACRPSTRGCSRRRRRKRRPRHVVVVGSGYVGLELAEAFVERRTSVTIIEAEPEVMGTLDPDMGASSPGPCATRGSRSGWERR